MKISKGTIARTLVLVLALINEALAVMGKSEIAIADDTIYQIVSLLATSLAAIIAAWKNNSYSKAALAGDELMKSLKANGDDGEQEA